MKIKNIDTKKTKRLVINIRINTSKDFGKMQKAY